MRVQEDIENRTINLAISTTRLTWRALVSGYRAYKQQKAKLEITEKEMQEKRANPSGKQTVKELIRKDQGVTSIPIGDTGIRDFERIARKYGIDYAITKDKSET
ncbi:MAG: PcfB family protein, partial [Firmicutes bacterium]|nr:PcfB family protein [Bacillota bacterium]